MAIVSATVGPAGSTRFSTRRCGVPRRRRRPAGSSGRSCRCAAGARLATACRPDSSSSSGSSSSITGQQRREVAHVLLEQVEDRVDPALAEPDASAGRPAPSAPRCGCRWPARTAAPGSRATARGRAGTASWRRARAARRRWPGRRSSRPRSFSGLTWMCSWVLVQAASGHDRVRRGAQPLGTADVDHDVLAPGGQDLVAEQLVARVGRQRRRAHVGRRQGGQDADHHHVGADLGRLGLGGVEAGAACPSRTR